MNYRSWDLEFKEQNKELFDKLDSKDEKNRLWAVAALEEKCFAACCISKHFLEALVRLMENDQSSIVRAMCMRALYHEASEALHYDKEDKQYVTDAIKRHERDMSGAKADTRLAYEIQSVEQRMRWLRVYEDKGRYESP